MEYSLNFGEELMWALEMQNRDLFLEEFRFFPDSESERTKDVIRNINGKLNKLFMRHVGPDGEIIEGDVKIDLNIGRVKASHELFLEIVRLLNEGDKNKEIIESMKPSTDNQFLDDVGEEIYNKTLEKLKEDRFILMAQYISGKLYVLDLSVEQEEGKEEKAKRNFDYPVYIEDLLSKLVSGKDLILPKSQLVYINEDVKSGLEEIISTLNLEKVPLGISKFYK